MDGCKEVVLLVIEHIVAHGHTRCDQFGDAALHHFIHLGQSFLSLDGLAFLLGILQLVADGHSLARPDELGQIGIEGVMGESGHLGAYRSAIVSLGQRDAEYARCLNGVVAIGLVEVAAAKQHEGVGMLGLQREKLSHHGG